MKRTATVAAFVVGTLALVPTARADGSIIITTPTEGSTISRSTGFNLSVAGEVSFVTRAPIERKFFLVGDPGACGDPYSAPSRLTLEPGDDSSAWALLIGGSDVWGCSIKTEWRTPVLVSDDESDDEEAYGDPGVPYTLDASKPITGAFVISPDVQGLGGGVGQVEVDFTLTGDTSGQKVTIGTASDSHILLPTETRHEFRFTIQPPPSLDRQDYTALTLTTEVHGLNQQLVSGHGYVVQDGASYMVVPGYTASFGAPRVEVAVDDGEFSAADITLSADGTSWSGLIPTPPASGAHVLYARSIQGDVPQAQTSVSIKVTA